VVASPTADVVGVDAWTPSARTVLSPERSTARSWPAAVRRDDLNLLLVTLETTAPIDSRVRIRCGRDSPTSTVWSMRACVFEQAVSPETLTMPH